MYAGDLRWREKWFDRAADGGWRETDLATIHTAIRKMCGWFAARTDEAEIAEIERAARFEFWWNEIRRKRRSDERTE
jgi:hypothetical protein